MRDMSTQYHVGRFEGAVDEQVRQMFRQHLRSPRPWSIGEKEPDYVPLPDDVADRLQGVDESPLTAVDFFHLAKAGLDLNWMMDDIDPVSAGVGLPDGYEDPYAAAAREEADAE